MVGLSRSKVTEQILSEQGVLAASASFSEPSGTGQDREQKFPGDKPQKLSNSLQSGKSPATRRSTPAG